MHKLEQANKWPAQINSVHKMSCQRLGHMGQKLGICRPFKAEGEDCNVFDGRQSEQRRSGGILRDTHQGYKELSSSAFLATSLSPHPPTRWACTCGWKRYPTLPLHMTVWWFTPSVSPSHLTRWPSLLCTWLCWEETLCSERLKWVGGRGGRYGSTHIQALKVEQMLRLVIMWMFGGICGRGLPPYFNEIKWFEI